MYAEREGRAWSPLSLSNLRYVFPLFKCLDISDFGLAPGREQETALKLSSRSIAGREKTVEFVITNVSNSKNLTRPLSAD